jgi:hypothetical protein
MLFITPGLTRTGTFLVFNIRTIYRLIDHIEYTGKVYVYNSGLSQEIVILSKQKLHEYGVNPDDIQIIDVPEGVPVGAILVTIWPHYLSVAKVKHVRDGSIYAPQLFNIDI